MKFFALTAIPAIYAVSLPFPFGDNCEWLHGVVGQEINCLPGWIATGACSSGSREACHEHSIGQNFSTLLKCCPHKYTNDIEHDCSQYSAKKGEQVYCARYLNERDSNNYFTEFNGLCASASDKSCRANDGTDHYVTYECCSTKDVTVGPEELCGWFYGASGDKLTCTKNFAVAGYCGSGKDSDCADKTAYHGIFCCPFTDNR